MNSSGRNGKKDRKPVTDLPSVPKKPTILPPIGQSESPSSLTTSKNDKGGSHPPNVFSNQERRNRIDDAVSEPAPAKFKIRPVQERSRASIPNAPPTSSFNRIEYQRRLSDWLFQPPTLWNNRIQLQFQIGQQILHRSKSMDDANFVRVSKLDLESMAELYDQYFFRGLCLPLARSYGLTFRLSSRMTRAGGKTTRTVSRETRSRPGRTHYEIALSTSLLFQSFRNPEDTIRVCGYDCQDRLTAMQRVVEHEMVHLCEMLAWIHSDCAANRFQSIARNLFGHTEHKHELITQQERAAKEFNIRAGSMVVFEFEGKKLKGIVNRITRRATILVEDPRGLRYTNGRQYLKYYVPIHQLRPIK